MQKKLIIGFTPKGETASKDLFWLAKAHNICVVGGKLNTSSSKA